MTLLALDPSRTTTTDRCTLTAAETAVARLGRTIDPAGTEHAVDTIHVAGTGRLAGDAHAAQPARAADTTRIADTTRARRACDGPGSAGADALPPGFAAAPAAPTTVRVHLVPDLAPAPRPAPVGPASTRPPLIDDRILARRRESLAAERAARTEETTRGAAPATDPTSTCCSLVLAAVEVLAGTRPMAQLARWVTPSVYEALAGRAALSLSAVETPRATRRPEVRRVRVCRIGDHVTEASVVVDDGRRVRAAAVRLEAWRGAWRAVALEIG